MVANLAMVVVMVVMVVLVVVVLVAMVTNLAPCRCKEGLVGTYLS
jgi:hypothetical protein